MPYAPKRPQTGFPDRRGRDDLRSSAAPAEDRRPHARTRRPRRRLRKATRRASPAAACRALLSAKDGVFEGEDGKASPWPEALLGPEALFKASRVILGVQA